MDVMSKEAWAGMSKEIRGWGTGRPTGMRNRYGPAVVCDAACLGARHHRRDVGQQLPRIVDDAVLDRVLDASDAFGATGAIVQPQRAGAVQHLQILERVLIDDDQIGEQARPHECRTRAACPSARASACAPWKRRRSNHLQRMEAGFLQQLELLDVAEAIELVDEARVRARRDAAAAVLEVVQERHPDAVEVLPGDLVFGRPVEPVRPVVLAVRLKEVPRARQRVGLVPFGRARAHQVAVGRVDRHRRIERRPAPSTSSSTRSFHSLLPRGWILSQSRATWPNRCCSSL